MGHRQSSAELHGREAGGPEKGGLLSEERRQTPDWSGTRSAGTSLRGPARGCSCGRARPAGGLRGGALGFEATSRPAVGGPGQLVIYSLLGASLDARATDAAGTDQAPDSGEYRSPDAHVFLTSRD